MNNFSFPYQKPIAAAALLAYFGFYLMPLTLVALAETASLQVRAEEMRKDDDAILGEIDSQTAAHDLDASAIVYHRRIDEGLR